MLSLFRIYDINFFSVGIRAVSNKLESLPTIIVVSVELNCSIGVLITSTSASLLACFKTKHFISKFFFP